jgi:hypothetical protein
MSDAAMKPYLSKLKSMLLKSVYQSFGMASVWSNFCLVQLQLKLQGLGIEHLNMGQLAGQLQSWGTLLEPYVSHKNLEQAKVFECP